MTSVLPLVVSPAHWAYRHTWVIQTYAACKGERNYFQVRGSHLGFWELSLCLPTETMWLLSWMICKKNFFIKAWHFVQVGALNIFRDGAMVVAILVSAITELCIWRHISWTKHGNTVKMMSTPIFWWSRITMVNPSRGKLETILWWEHTSHMLTHEYSVVISTLLHEFSVITGKNTPIFKTQSSFWSPVQTYSQPSCHVIMVCENLGQTLLY